MKNELMFFEGVEIEILTKEDIDFDGEVLFNGKQVCNILEYTNSSKAISDHIRDNQKVKVKNSDIKNTNFRKLNNAGEIFITNVGIIALIQKATTVSLDFKEKFKEFLVKNNFIEDKVIAETKKETEFIKKLKVALEPFYIEKFETQYVVKNDKGSNYRIDLYLPKLNIAIEYDENDHKQYTYEQHEGREAYIEEKLGCKFIRVSDKNSDEYNIGYVIKAIFEMNNNTCKNCGCNMKLFDGEYICGNCGNIKEYMPCYPF